MNLCRHEEGKQLRWSSVRQRQHSRLCRLCHRVERLCVAHVKDHHDAIRAAVVVASNGPEPLLPGGIPLAVTQRGGQLAAR